MDASLRSLRSGGEMIFLRWTQFPQAPV